MPSSHDTASSHHTVMPLPSLSFPILPSPLIPILTRLSCKATTALFATCGMKLWVFVISALVSLPKNFVNVYIGARFETDSQGVTTNTSKLINGIVLAVTVVVTIVAMRFITAQINAVKPGIIYQRRKARLVYHYTILARAFSDAVSDATVYLVNLPCPPTASLINRSRRLLGSTRTHPDQTRRAATRPARTMYKNFHRFLRCNFRCRFSPRLFRFIMYQTLLMYQTLRLPHPHSSTYQRLSAGSGEASPDLRHKQPAAHPIQSDLESALLIMKATVGARRDPGFNRLHTPLVLAFPNEATVQAQLEVKLYQILNLDMLVG